MDKKKLLGKIEHELIRLEKIRLDNNWEQVRKIENYEVVQNDYDWLSKPALKIPDDKYQLYVDLQASRGLQTNLYTEKSLEEFLNTCKQGSNSDDIPITSEDFERLWELERDVEFGRNSKTQKVENFVELGFRAPKLLDYYRKQHNLNCVGFDVVELSVLVAEYLDYEAHILDLNKCNKKYFRIPPCSLVISYHNIEHLTDPLKAIKFIYDSMGAGNLLHIEVPIETDKEYPNIEKGHLYSFQPLELSKMLDLVGFKILNTTIRCISRQIERYLVEK